VTAPGSAASYDAGAWAVLHRRLSPWLDPALGVAATALSVVSLVGTDVATIDPRLDPADPVSVLATAVAGASLAWRRSRPVTAFAVFLACSTLVSLTGHYIGLLSVLLLVSLYSLAAHGRRREGALGAVAAIAVYGALALLGVPDLRTGDLLQAGALVLAAWALGDAIRSRRNQQAEMLRAAEQEAATAREHAARAVVEERLRIARELHDVVAHSMSLIAVQAGVGGHVIQTDVAAAGRSLEIIAETSRKALAQTRSMLGLLREEGTGIIAAPAHTVEDLGTLVEELREVGVDVRLDVTGPARPLDPAVELAAYRVVQESLTNVLRHSGAERAVVRVSYLGDALDLEVCDPGSEAGRAPRNVAAPSGGHGLAGLEERARLLGGTLDYGTDGTGFRVRARLPAGARTTSS
jgi:signal transduction histidine kinase